jgi:hypothetical protein
MTVKVQRSRPRVWPKNWYSDVKGSKFQLSEDLHEQLCEIAGLDPGSRKANKMLFCVEEELGMFEPRKNALDHGPRPTHKRLLLERVLKAAREDPPDFWIEAAEGLTSWAGPLAWEFHLEGFPRDADEDFFEKEWVKFVEAVLLKLSGKESRHGSTQKAKHRLRNELAWIFDRYNEAEHEDGRQVLKADFVDTASTAVGFPKSDPKKLERRSTSRLARELPESFTPAMARRGARLYKGIVAAAEAKGQSLEVFLTENPTYYDEYRKAAGLRVKKS